jgi:hypothetical protein
LYPNDRISYSITKTERGYKCVNVTVLFPE